MKCVVELSEGVSIKAAARICLWLRHELSDSVFQRDVKSVNISGEEECSDGGT
jgi:hypothetical protein